MQVNSNQNNKFVPDRKLKLMDQVKQVMRYHHYAYKTEQAYCEWIMRYIKFHNKKHPAKMGKSEIETYLSYLATHANVAASTQRQALNALVFLYDKVLLQEISGELALIRSRKNRRPPVVMSQDEVARVLQEISGVHALMLQLLYGCGLRLMECLRLRIKDIDFERKKIFVRDGKGSKDRVTLFPNELHKSLQMHIKKVQKLHQQDVKEGYGEVWLPHALNRKYANAATLCSSASVRLRASSGKVMVCGLSLLLEYA
ncbi:MAG: integron integrase [Calditrichaeota bacterium]|nr:MAG: integron integrase [Calditrichota bacterium]